MKQFENKVLFIKDEEMLKEVKELIYDFLILDNFGFCNDGKDYLYYNQNEEYFSIILKCDSDQEITLKQFKELLKQK